MNDKLQQLADGTPSHEQYSRARELCGDSEALHAELDALIKTMPTRGQVLDFLESPSPQDRLMAMQIGMLHEQNEILQQISHRVGTIAKSEPLTFSGVLGAVVFGNMLTR